MHSRNSPAGYSRGEEAREREFTSTRAPADVADKVEKFVENIKRGPTGSRVEIFHEKKKKQKKNTLK